MRRTIALAGQARGYSVVILPVKGMLSLVKGTAEAPGKNEAQKSGLNRGLAHAGFGEMCREVEYRPAWRGGVVLFAGQFVPTSRSCSGCGSYQSEFSLKIRYWTRPAFGAVHDRDGNAAKNIVALAPGPTPGATAGKRRK